MNQRLFIASFGFLVLVMLANQWLPNATTPVARSTLAQEEAEKSGRRIVAAARELLESLSEKERETASFAFEDGERTNWHFIPRERPGLSLKSMDEKKREKSVALLDASLSAAGFEKAEQVRELEAILAEIEGPNRRLPRDPLLYHVSLFGKPSDTEAWGWRFEGHHLSLNYTLRGNELVSATPSFFGANPAEVKEGPHKGLRVLAGIEDVARELVRSLDEKQLEASRKTTGDEDAVPEEVPDTEKARYSGPFPAGIEASALTREQRQILRRLIAQYRANLPQDVAREIMARIRESELRTVRFAWAGGLERGEPHSYLVHGPTFVINYSNRQNDGNHIHASFRELRHDFGANAAGEGSEGGEGSE